MATAVVVVVMVAGGASSSSLLEVVVVISGRVCRAMVRTRMAAVVAVVIVLKGIGLVKNFLEC